MTQKGRGIMVRDLTILEVHLRLRPISFKKLILTI